MPETLERESGKLGLAACGQSLDPGDWEGFRQQAHLMLDDMIGYTKDIRRRPVWQPIPREVRERFRAGVPDGPCDLAEVHREFMDSILPFAAGNVHPGFMGWVHGGGTPVGMLAEMLAAGLNANLGGRDHVPVEVERQVGRWMQEIFGFPETAAGLFVTGTSMANLVAMVVARDVALGYQVRREGVSSSKRLTAYASAEAHGCIAKALDLCGIGSDSLRLIPADQRRRMDLAKLEEAIGKDREAGFHPFVVVGTAGTVNTGAVDDLAGIAEIAEREKVWFHVDGAYGALAMLAPDLAPKLAGIERADSLAFDFHKWGQVPYDAGFLLVRDGGLQRNAFAASDAYLRRETRGLAAGTTWPCEYGPDLSRGFRALKTWFTLKVYGTKAIGDIISRTCELTRYLKERVANTPALELLAPVELNIVCFRYRAEDSDRVNARIVVELQESGAAAPSTTMIDGRLAIRAAMVNHRTNRSDVDRLVEMTLAIGRKLTATPSVASTKTAEGLPPRLRWRAELEEVESGLESNPESIDLRFRRASLLHMLDRLVEATDEYARVLQREPGHLMSLNGLAVVLIALGYRNAARVQYKEAVARHPDDAMSRTNLGLMLAEDSELIEAFDRPEKALETRKKAREHLEQALRVNPHFEKAHEGLSYILGPMGDEAGATYHRREAFRERYIIPVPYRGDRPPIPVLKLTSTMGGNVKLQRFLDARIFQTFIVLPEFYNPKTPLPKHQLVVNAIGDAEMSAGALAAAQSVLALTTAPVINHPSTVLATSRSNNARRLYGLPGVVTPRTITLPRERLADGDPISTLASNGFRFPLLLRAPGFHTGLHFVKVDSAEELPKALEKIPSPEVLVMEYLDARGADGKSRKYRVMMVNGQLYPLHVAISSQWKIHYFTAEMANSPEHRGEDAAFLENMPDVLGAVAMEGLKRIQSVLSLDYAGIDFGLNAKGEVLLFEANATMVVNPPEPDIRWNYRRPACERIRSAVQRMLLERALLNMSLCSGAGLRVPLSMGMLATEVTAGPPI